MELNDMGHSRHGNVRVAYRRRPGSEVTDVVVTMKTDDKNHVIMFDGPDLIIKEKSEMESIDWEEEALLTFDALLGDQVRDVFFALAKLFGMKNDAEEAYQRGRLEGENKVLWAMVNPDPRFNPPSGYSATSTSYSSEPF